MNRIRRQRTQKNAKNGAKSAWPQTAAGFAPFSGIILFRYYFACALGVQVFLSNSAEAEKLCTPWYQQRVAWGIHVGILQYLNKNRK